MNNETHTSSSISEAGAAATSATGKDFIYARIAGQLRQAIAANEYPNGRLPTERVLGVRFGASLGTIRKALELLAQDGVILRRQGSGTYIGRVDEKHPPYNTRRTHLICYLSGTGTEAELGNFFNRLMIASHTEIERAGYATVVAGIHGGRVPVPILKQKVDGVIVAGTYQARDDKGRQLPDFIEENRQFVGRLVKAGLPVVTISNPAEVSGIHRITMDYDAALREGLSYLKEHGHRRIAVFGGPRIWPAFGDRLDAFVRQVGELGLEFDERLICEYLHWPHRDKQAVLERVRDHFRSGSGATAGIVISGSPLLVTQPMNEAGLRCPEDFSLISFTDIPRSQDNPPVYWDPDTEMPEGMTTLVMPVEQMAKQSVQRLIDLMEGRSAHADQGRTTIPLTLLSGNTVLPYHSPSQT